MITKKLSSLIVLSYLLFCPSELLAVRMANVEDGAETFLYGRREVTPGLIQKIIEDIDQPETDFWLKQSPPRTEEEADIILIKTKLSLQEKLTEETDTLIKGRLNSFIAMDLSEYPKIPLSYLIEKIYSNL